MTRLVWTIPDGDSTARWATDDGGGSQPGVAQFAFTFDTPGLEDGVVFYTPTSENVASGLWLLDFWFQVDTAFDGTTPKADVATAAGQGLWAAVSEGSLLLSHPATELGGFLATANVGYIPGSVVAAGGYAQQYDGNRPVGPYRITTTNPLLCVVSQSGDIGGDPVGGTTGAAILCYRIGKP